MEQMEVEMKNFAEIEQATEYIKENICECCQELLDWGSTGILVDGYVRKAAAMIAKLDKVYDLAIAEDIVKKQAFIFIAEKQYIATAE